jgi:hypothetical protein
MRCVYQLNNTMSPDVWDAAWGGKHGGTVGPSHERDGLMGGVSMLRIAIYQIW